MHMVVVVGKRGTKVKMAVVRVVSFEVASGSDVYALSPHTHKQTETQRHR
jgi:hypothetical protein